MSTTTATTAEQAGRRVEEILDRLAGAGDPQVSRTAEELVRVLMEFYGAGLARAVELLGAGRSGDPLAPLLGDELVASLLVLHGLHPDDVHTRIARALGGLPHAVENAGFDPADGVLRLKVTAATGCGCPSTQESVRQAAADSLACFAPEVTTVEMEPDGASREPVLLQIGTAPPNPGTGGRRRPPATAP
ncbi:hypothetical protein DIZ27_10740 [Streptomyces sp. NWU339]|uniref:hypothetical protein n=1 Tax=Streptomyces sp. NWU339 TaxID=2185284 RepID=UPI000D68147B|nr:hypothetical protein [Streptomyces sp. NWU339]PWI10469.1 hypothetical protein DIZ27_10740 [Streptomyces sp. NWU339]